MTDEAILGIAVGRLQMSQAVCGEPGVGLACCVSAQTSGFAEESQPVEAWLAPILHARRCKESLPLLRTNIRLRMRKPAIRSRCRSPAKVLHNCRSFA
jgi:hypothetical protein